MNNSTKKIFAVICSLYIACISLIDIFMVKYPCLNNEGLGIKCYNLQNQQQFILNFSKSLYQHLPIMLLLNIVLFIFLGILIMISKASKERFIIKVSKITFVIFIITMLIITFLSIKYFL